VKISEINIATAIIIRHSYLKTNKENKMNFNEFKIVNASEYENQKCENCEAKFRITHMVDNVDKTDSKFVCVPCLNKYLFKI
jgi:hypothetical protein